MINTVLDGILGVPVGSDAAVSTKGGKYLTTADKNDIANNKTPLTILAVGERTSFRWQKPEWVLKLTVGDDVTERLLTIDKGSKDRDTQIGKMVLYFASKESRDKAGKNVPLTGLTLGRSENRSRTWLFVAA